METYFRLGVIEPTFFSLLPAQFITADMVPDNVGTWMFHCHVDEHMEAGMTAMYEVMP